MVERRRKIRRRVAVVEIVAPARIAAIGEEGSSVLQRVLYFVVEASVLEWWFVFSSRRRHTSVDCDWSSDVCSSDLLPPRSPSVDHGSETANLPRFALLLHDR